MKIAVSAYSFEKLVKDGTYTHLSLIQKVKDMGFDAIEYSGIYPPEGVSHKEYAEMLKEESKRVGIEIINYAFNAEFITCPDFDAEISRAKEQIDIAEALGVKMIRHDATFNSGGKAFDNCLTILADACRQLTEYAEAKGIRTSIENHGFFCQDATRVEKLVATVNHPNFGLLCDMGNFLCADEDPAYSFGIVAPFAFHVHAKDFHVKPSEGADPGEGFFRSRKGNYLRGSIIGHGNVPIKSCLYILKNAGYSGALSIEFEGMEDNETAVRIGLDNLKRYISEVGL